MLIRRTAKNQVVIPKALLKEAGLAQREFPFFDITVQSGGFFLKPMKAEALGKQDELFQLLDRFERRAKAHGLTEADAAREVKAHRKEKAARRAAA